MGLFFDHNLMIRSGFIQQKLDIYHGLIKSERLGRIHVKDFEETGMVQSRRKGIGLQLKMR